MKKIINKWLEKLLKSLLEKVTKDADTTNPKK